MHIVVFPGWYPNRADKLSGDFIQRHMQAISQFCRVTVIIPIKDSSISKPDIVTINNTNLTEIYCYYPSQTSINWLDNFLSFLRYNYLCIVQARKLFKNQKPDLSHVYVLQKNHLAGWLLQWLYKIPFVISEQSTFYVDGRFEKMNLLQKRIYQFVYNKAASVHAVSVYLLKTLHNKLKLHKEGVVIPNVVDVDKFYYAYDAPKDRITFVHVSNMVYQKNVEGMLQAFAEVKKVNANFLLHLVGPLPSSISSLIIDLNLGRHVVTWHERHYKEVADIMQQSDVFVFFTRYETFGCVIIEANACGLPVITSDLDVTRELISDGFNGLLVKSENIKDLADSILSTLANPAMFDPIAISLQARRKYNYDQVGQQFYDWYDSILQSSK